MIHEKSTKMRYMYNYFIYITKRYENKILTDCYVNPSHHKENAYKYCLDLFNKYDGEYYTILTYNTFMFTFGFIGKIEDKKAFFYITKEYYKYIFIEEVQK